MLKTDLRHIDIDLVTHIVGVITNQDDEKQKIYFTEYNNMLIMVIEGGVADTLRDDIIKLEYPCITSVTEQECIYCDRITNARDVIVTKNKDIFEHICEDCDSKIWQIRHLMVFNHIYKCGLNHVCGNGMQYRYSRVQPAIYTRVVKYGYCVLCKQSHKSWDDYCADIFDRVYRYYMIHLAKQYWVILYIDTIADVKARIIKFYLAAHSSYQPVIQQY